ncbi:peptidyl-dipeptidase Dcp [Sphingomonas naasensis]|uniref:M3 family peptidase n=1 Tax=Sphingomonas naasensis TaxID=1344951 RepID=A0A4S1WIE0_9SPHN|nr:M3 family metallopeptidase [Sphingomonas naasensis]NIJ21499.1 peptidyl-dipeptidase Dcp [Sphingomonas naasensis]TGX41547.1 M3 family peptidase [Sphingomonas naasensis]
MTRSLRLALIATTALAATPVPGSTMPQNQTHTSPAPATTPDPTPLLAKWPGPHEGVPQWDKVVPAMFPPAFERAMANARAEMVKIRDNPAAPTFQNTIEADQRSGEEMNRLFAVWGVYQSNLATPEVQAIAKEWSPKLSAFFTEMSLDPKMFARVKAIHDGRAKAGLNPQQLRLLERTYRDYVTSGALLDEAGKAEVKRINQDLATAYTEFSRKVLADEETAILLDSEADLAGLADSFKASLAEEAKARGQVGKWAIKNTRSSVQPFLMYATNRALREKVYNAFVNRGDNGDANDTNATIAQILKLRRDRAKLLGFKNHAWYRMDDTMAETPENASKLMLAVWPAAVARVREEVADMQALASKEGAGITIAPWDYRFYAEKVRKAKYDLDENEVKPYLQLDQILQGAFYAAGRLYDLDFKENTGSVPVFHPDVRTFRVTNRITGAEVGIFYFDGYARSGKRSGAWATSYRTRSGLRGTRIVLASNNNNFTKGAAGEPTLISIDDATTLFHEFGHALHSLLGNVYYPGLAGTPRDFVEYPSQVNENWLLTPDVLNRFARHYKTGAPIPAALVAKIEKAQTFNQGFDTVEYLSSAIVDMKLHDRDTPVTDPDAFERETLASIGMPKEIVMRHRLPQFNHLFSSDAYSAGYYSYLWSETMDADTWAAFEETGNVWDKATADKFRTILLMTGNETDRKEAYRVFRGRDPDVKALFRRRGFPVE